MATSGSFKTNKYTSSSGKTKGLQFTWSRTGYDISGNYSDISWEWKGYGTGGGYHLLRSSYLNVNGDRVYTQGSGSKELYDGTVVKSGTTRIYHNADGTKSFSADGGGAIYVTDINCTGSNSWTLDTIPRYFTSSPTLTLVSKTETTATYNWTTPEACDQVQYRLNGGGWVDVWTGSATSGSYTITGLSPNTYYNVEGDFKRQDSQQWSTWGSYGVSAPVTTYAYPYLVASNNFTIGNSIPINLYNPLGRSLNLTIYGNDNSVINTAVRSIHGYTEIANNVSEIDSQYASIPNSNEGTYKVRIVCSALSRDTTVTASKYYATDCDPTFNDFTYRDSNSTVSAVTGNDQLLVKGLSTLEVTISSANKMTTQKHATPNKYAISCDTLNKEETYSSSTITSSVGVINSSGSKRLTITAYDSRNNSDQAYKDITVLDYAKPVINAIATRLNDFENETTLKVSGTFTKLMVNNVAKNTITQVQYRYRETNGTWGSWTNITYTISDNTYTCNDVILSLDNTKSFEFDIRVVDNLQTNTNTTNVDIGQAIFFISSNNRACYINGQEILQYDVVDTW